MSNWTIDNHPGTLKFDSSKNADRVFDIGKLVKAEFDYVAVTAKNGAGDPTTIVYKTGGSGGTTVATLTITYDVDGDFESATVS